MHGFLIIVICYKHWKNINATQYSKEKILLQWPNLFSNNIYRLPDCDFFCVYLFGFSFLFYLLLSNHSGATQLLSLGEVDIWTALSECRCSEFLHLKMCSNWWLAQVDALYCPTLVPTSRYYYVFSLLFINWFW